MSTQPRPFLTPEEYLEIERKAEYKSEFYQGQMFAMSGVTRRHDDIALDLAVLIKQHIRGKRCWVHSSDMRVLVAAHGLYTYPDLSVFCGSRQYADTDIDTLTNPLILVEVLSPSTERYDRIAKVPMYKTIPTLQECLVIAQDRHHVEHHRRMADGTWCLTEATGAAASLELVSIGYTLRLHELYETALPESGPA